ncbi:unnamed protein product [Spodoptera exigua]|nr:unnamed protein product [Spodoptera exigua]
MYLVEINATESRGEPTINNYTTYIVPGGGRWGAPHAAGLVDSWFQMQYSDEASGNWDHKISDRGPSRRKPHSDLGGTLTCYH